MSGYGTWTSVDLANAVAYANDQINYKKCKDPRILKKKCPDKEDCLVWKEGVGLKLYEDPINYYDPKQVCKQNDDCKFYAGSPDCVILEGKTEGLCGYDPLHDKRNHPDGLHSGICRIATEDLCKVESKLPYDCSKDKSCPMIYEPQKCEDEKDCKGCKDKKCPCKTDNDCKKGECRNGVCYQLGADKNYLEWRPEISCGDNSPCQNGLSCVGNKCGCRPGEDNKCPGNSICKDGVCTGGRCVFGNWMLKQWCENPPARCQKSKDDETYPPSCGGSGSKGGVTDVPGFAYNDKTGACYMTPGYCKYFGYKYENDEATETQCKNGGDCKYSYETCIDGKCRDGRGQCTESSGQKVGEMFLGKTLFRFFTGGCPSYNPPLPIPLMEKFETDEEGLRNIEKDKKVFPKMFDNLFSSYPDTIVKNADSKYMKKKKLLMLDFICPGVSLYSIIWENGKKEVGVDADEVKKHIPNVVLKKDGKKVISIKKTEITKDKRVKKLYLTLGSSKLFQNFLK